MSADEPNPVLASYDAGEPAAAAAPLAAGGQGGDNWEGCPFEVLGAGRRARYWLLDARGIEVEFDAERLTKWSSLMHLTRGYGGWLEANYPGTDRDGNPSGFSGRAVVAAIMRRTAELPPFDPDMPRRYYGLWKVADGFALHLGNRVIWDGEEFRAGFVEEDALWCMLAPRDGPAEPAEPEAGVALETLLGTWNFRDPRGPAIMLGLIVAGWLAGVLPWRPHGMVSGEPGSGKTTLLHRVVAGLCPLTRYLNDYTAAGVRQLLQSTAGCVVLDEAEHNPRSEDRIQSLLEMFRKASSGSGFQGVRGSMEQVAKTADLMGSVILGAVLEPPMDAQDLSRFTPLQLGPLKAPEKDSGVAEFVAAHGPSLWGRALANVDRCLALIRVLRKRLVARGCTARQADQLSAIAACRWVLTEHEADDPQSAEDEVLADMPLAIVAHLILSDEERVSDSTGNQALARLLASPLDMAGDKLTLGQALTEYRRTARIIARQAGDETMSEDTAKRSERLEKLKLLLEGHGVRWARCEQARPPDAPQAPVGLLVLVQEHPRLAKVFEGSAWAGKRWGGALAQLPGALGGKALPPRNFAGMKKARCVWVPGGLVGDTADDD